MLLVQLPILLLLLSFSIGVIQSFPLIANHDIIVRPSTIINQQWRLLPVRRSYHHQVQQLVVTPKLMPTSFSRRTLVLNQSSPSEENPNRPELVKKSDFLSAFKTLQLEIAKVNGVSTDLDETKNKNENVDFAIGRIQAQLSIPPQIDLIETPSLVLINGVSQSVVDSGVQVLDTIVSVSSLDGSLKKRTLGVGLEEMFSSITQVINYAREKDHDVILVEVNRLIQGYYGD